MENRSDKRETEILNSIDGLQPAEVSPFFYTRLTARMQNEMVVKKEPFILLRPAFLMISMSVILMINIIFLFQYRQDKDSQTNQHAATIETFANAYGLNQSTVYE